MIAVFARRPHLHLHDPLFGVQRPASTDITLEWSFFACVLWTIAFPNNIFFCKKSIIHLSTEPFWNYRFRYHRNSLDPHSDRAILVYSTATEHKWGRLVTSVLSGDATRAHTAYLQNNFFNFIWSLIFAILNGLVEKRQLCACFFLLVPPLFYSAYRLLAARGPIDGRATGRIRGRVDGHCCSCSGLDRVGCSIWCMLQFVKY